MALTIPSNCTNCPSRPCPANKKQIFLDYNIYFKQFKVQVESCVNNQDRRRSRKLLIEFRVPEEDRVSRATELIQFLRKSSKLTALLSSFEWSVRDRQKHFSGKSSVLDLNHRLLEYLDEKQRQPYSIYLEVRGNPVVPHDTKIIHYGIENEIDTSVTTEYRMPMDIFEYCIEKFLSGSNGLYIQFRWQFQESPLDIDWLTRNGNVTLKESKPVKYYPCCTKHYVYMKRQEGRPVLSINYTTCRDNFDGEHHSFNYTFTCCWGEPYWYFHEYYFRLHVMGAPKKEPQASQ